MTPELTVRFALEDDSLVIDYSVHSPGPPSDGRDAPIPASPFAPPSTQTIYLLNKLHRGEDPPEFDPDLAYVKLRPNGVVDVTKRTLYPKHQVYRRIYAHPTRLDPGQRFRERVRLALPLCENVQYEPSYRREESHTTEYQRICFSLQFFRALPGTHEDRVRVGDRELLFVESPVGRLHQAEVLQSPVVELRLPVCPRPSPQPAPRHEGCPRHRHGHA